MKERDLIVSALTYMMDPPFQRLLPKLHYKTLFYFHHRHAELSTVLWGILKAVKNCQRPQEQLQEPTCTALEVGTEAPHPSDPANASLE